MQNKKQLKLGKHKDRVLTFLAIFFLSGTLALITLMIYYLSTSGLI